MAQSDDSLKSYLTNIKGSTASMGGYLVSLQGNITGFNKVSDAIVQYNALHESGIKEQAAFSTAVSATNNKLGNYLTSLNGAKASLGGYVISLASAAVKTIALQAATIALNAALTMGISVIISGIVSAISDWIHKTENIISASEKAEEKIKSINEEFKNHQKIISDTAERYAKLAQGVEQLTGKNISLTDEEYEEFLSLSNQLAEIFPTLTRNYDDNGNAIIQLSGDVDTIVNSLHNLIEAQRDLANSQIIEELPQKFDGVVANSNQYERELRELEDKKNALIQGLETFTPNNFSKKIQNGLDNKYFEIVSNNLTEYSRLVGDYQKLLSDAGLKFESINHDPIWNGEYDNDGNQILTYKASIYIESSDEDVENAKQIIGGKVEDLATQYETNINSLNEKIKTTNEKNKSNWTSLSSSIFAWLSTDDSFKVMDDTMQSTIQSIVNNLSWSSLDFSSWEDAKQYIQDNILSLFDTEEGRETLSDIKVMLDMQTQFNNGDMTINEYQEKIQGFLSNIENLPDETKKSIMWLFGIEINEDNTTSSDIDNLINNVKEKLQDKFDDKVGDLTLEELKIAAEQIEVSEDTLLSWDELIKKIESYKHSTDNTSFSDRFKKLWDSDSFSDAKEDLTKLAKESRITGKDIQSLAKENSELAVLLDESGMSAQFAATCFNKMCYGADGFSAITEDALALDKVLHGMDESLQKVTASKSAYDKAMEQDDYNSDFENYQEAYKSGMEMFENGEYGKKFRSTMEFLFGEDSYTMSIEELYSAMNSLKSVFGEDATNGLEFLDKLYAKKDILDDMGSSLVRLSDGSYDFDLKPEEFEKIGDALGMTAEEVAACTNALGMFGDYHAYDLEELEETLNGLSMSAKDGEKSIMSLQGLEDVFSDLGYTGYDIHNIVEDIKEMGSIELLDFGNTDTDAIQSVIDKLAKLNLIEINGDNIDVSGLISALTETFGMASEDIDVFLEGLNKKFNFVDSEGDNIIDKYKQLQKEINDTEAKIQTPTGTENISELQKKLEELQQQKEALRDPVEIQIDTRIERASAQLDEVSKKYDELKKKIQEKQAQGTATQADRHKLNELGSIKNSLETDIAEYNELKVTINVDREQADADIEDITSDKETNITATITNAQEVNNQFDEWTKPKNTKLTVDVVANDPNGLLNQTGQTGNSGNGSSKSGANKNGTGKTGTNHADGTVGNAFASGYNGLPKDEKNALRSEYGQEELTVYPNGTYEITDSPTMADLPKGTVIFNEEQTKRIIGNSFSKGTVGNAYAGGKAGGINPATKKPFRDYENTAVKQTQQAVEQAAEETAEKIEEVSEEVFDWIERRIQKFQRLFDKWVKQAETALTSGFITKYYKKATAAIKKELSTYSKAYSRYMKEANKVGLDSNYAKKVRSGTIDIETIQDEELADKIQKYQEWYIYYAPLSGNRWRHSI